MGMPLPINTPARAPIIAGDQGRIIVLDHLPTTDTRAMLVVRWVVSLPQGDTVGNITGPGGTSERHGDIVLEWYNDATYVFDSMFPVTLKSYSAGGWFDMTVQTK